MNWQLILSILYLATSIFGQPLKPSYDPYPELFCHKSKPSKRIVIDLNSLTRNSERLKVAKTPVAPSTFEKRMVDGVWRSLPRVPSKTKNSVLKPRASALPASIGNILVTAADGSTSFISTNLNPDGSLGLGPLSTALTVTLPSTSSTSAFTISNIAAAVDPTHPLSNGNPASKRSLTAQQIVGLLSAELIAAPEQLVVDQIKFDEISAYNNIVQAAQAAFDLIAFARDGDTPVADRSAPTLAADQTALTAYLAASATAGTAIYQALYTSCVASSSAKSTLITAYVTQILDHVDAAAAEAALRSIGSELTPNECAAFYAPIQAGLTGPQSTAFVNAIYISIQSDQQTATLLQRNLSDAQTNVNRAQSSAALIPGSGGISWTVEQDTKQLSARYINSDGSTVSPVIVFQMNNGIFLTGNYASYTSVNPSAGSSPVTLNFVSSS